jgi:hypothetical protein
VKFFLTLIFLEEMINCSYNLIVKYGATNSNILHNREGVIQVKNFSKNFYLEMTPLGVKTCRESEFDIFEAKKHLPNSGKACVLKRKIAFLRLFNTQALNQKSIFSLRKCLKFWFSARLYQPKIFFRKSFFERKRKRVKKTNDCKKIVLSNTK